MSHFSKKEMATLIEFQMKGIERLSCSCELIFRDDLFDASLVAVYDFEVDATTCTRTYPHTSSIYILNEKGKRYFLHLLRRDEEIIKRQYRKANK